MSNKKFYLKTNDIVSGLLKLENASHKGQQVAMENILTFFALLAEV